MTARQSDTFPELWLLSEEADFSSHANQLVQKSRRSIYLLSNSVDPAVYGTEDFIRTASEFVRSERSATLKILAQNIKPLIERRHPLVALARRLSSKVQIRKCLIEPESFPAAYLIGDNDKFLFKHDDDVYDGFINFKAGPEVKKYKEEFEWLWERHSEESADLRSLVI